jgi:hypothetical protein
VAAAAYLAIPIDPIPDFVPVLGDAIIEPDWDVWRRFYFAFSTDGTFDLRALRHWTSALDTQTHQ